MYWTSGAEIRKCTITSQTKWRCRERGVDYTRQWLTMVSRVEKQIDFLFLTFDPVFVLFRTLSHFFFLLRLIQLNVTFVDDNSHSAVDNCMLYTCR